MEIILTPWDKNIWSCFFEDFEQLGWVNIAEWTFQHDRKQNL